MFDVASGQRFNRETGFRHVKLSLRIGKGRPAPEDRLETEAQKNGGHAVVVARPGASPTRLPPAALPTAGDTPGATLAPGRGLAKVVNN